MRGRYVHPFFTVLSSELEATRCQLCTMQPFSLRQKVACLYRKIKLCKENGDLGPDSVSVLLVNIDDRPVYLEAEIYPFEQRYSVIWHYAGFQLLWVLNQTFLFQNSRSASTVVLLRDGFDCTRRRIC